MSEANAEIARRAYEAFGRGDLNVVLGSFAADIEFHAAESLPWGGLHNGREAVAKNVFGALGDVYDRFAVNPERYIESGDTLVVLGRYSGIGKASGKPFDAAFAHVWNLEDGLLKTLNHYADTARMLEVLS
jgi:uncharacterized protein